MTEVKLKVNYIVLWHFKPRDDKFIFTKCDDSIAKQCDVISERRAMILNTLPRVMMELTSLKLYLTEFWLL